MFWLLARSVQYDADSVHIIHIFWFTSINFKRSTLIVLIRHLEIQKKLWAFLHLHVKILKFLNECWRKRAKQVKNSNVPWKSQELISTNQRRVLMDGPDSRQFRLGEREASGGVNRGKTQEMRKDF